MSNNRLPFTLAVQPWFKDHSVGGKIVLPAVETMLLLAARCAAVHPDRDIRTMEDVHFGKFLEIPGAATTVPALVEWATDGDGRLQIKLLSQMQLGTMSRIKEHGEVFFPASKPVSLPPPDTDPAPPVTPVKEIPVEHLYRQLVPFGKHYQTLQDTLFLSKSGAWGKLKAPELPFSDPVQAVLGSPFPLDGAMHAACVLGQQFVDYPPFPVGFAKRSIYRPTGPGQEYLTRVTLKSLALGELVFDLDIFNNIGQLYECVSGIRMRDVRRAIKKQAA